MSAYGQHLGFYQSEAAKQGLYWRICHIHFFTYSHSLQRMNPIEFSSSVHEEDVEIFHSHLLPSGITDQIMIESKGQIKSIPK